MRCNCKGSHTTDCRYYGQKRVTQRIVLDSVGADLSQPFLDRVQLEILAAYKDGVGLVDVELKNLPALNFPRIVVEHYEVSITRNFMRLVVMALLFILRHAIDKPYCGLVVSASINKVEKELEEFGRDVK